MSDPIRPGLMSTPVPIATARQLGRTHRLPTVIILYELDDGRLAYTSYGQTKALCGRARRLADRAFEAIETTR